MVWFFHYFILLATVNAFAAAENNLTQPVVPAASNNRKRWYSKLSTKQLLVRGEDWHAVREKMGVGYTDRNFIEGVIKVRRPGNLLRGMALTFDDLKSLLKEGAKVGKTEHEGIYLTAIAGEPQYYANQNLHKFESSFAVIVEINPKSLRLHQTGPHHWVSSENIAPEAIEKVYVFNRKKKSNFPYEVFTKEELLDLLENQSNPKYQGIFQRLKDLLL